MYICSPIHEKDNESQKEQNTPIVTNPNYVTPQATGKNSRRLTAIGTNAPQQIHHESRLSGISPNPKGSENDMSIGVDSGSYPKPSNFSGTDQIVKSFKITASSVQANMSQSKSPLSSKVNKSDEDEQGDILWLLRKLGAAYQKQINYECVEAIKLYKKLPHQQRETGWVLTQLGCCNMDIQNYQDAERWFRMMRIEEPYTIEGLHNYST